MSEPVLPGGGRPRQRGFSLLEVLVAFSVLALSLAVLMQVFSATTRNVAVGADYTRALVLAESLLAAAGESLPLATPAREGAEGGLRWRLQSVPLNDPNGPSRVLPYHVRVTVTWTSATRERSVSLDTLKLERAP